MTSPDKPQRKKPQSFADLMPGSEDAAASHPPEAAPADGDGEFNFRNFGPREIHHIPLSDIVDDGHNHRMPSAVDDVTIAELSASMNRDGLLQPILAYRGIDGNFHAVYGFRRIAAARRLEWKTIPADVIASIPSDSEKHRLRAIENLRRKNLNAAEEALAVFELVDAHTPLAGAQGAIDQAAGDLGQDAKWVRDRLYVVGRLTKKTRQQLAEGQINFAHARELSKLGEVLQERLGRQIADIAKPPHGRISTVEDLRGWIANEKHSLRVVGWKLEIPFAGKPACVGCPFNSATDASLFETTNDEAEKGCCHNPACFDVKARKTGEAQDKAIEKLKGQVKAKKLDKAEAGGAEAVRGAVAEFVKPEAVQRKAKREFGAPASKASSGAEGKPAAKKVLTEKERRQAAMVKWSESFRGWRDCVGKAIDAACKSDPMKMVAAILLAQSKKLDESESFQNYEEYNFSQYGGYKNISTPTPEKAVTAPLAKFLDAVSAMDLDAFVTAAKDVKRGSFELNSSGPEMVARLARVFGVKVAAPAPVYEDFLPEDLKPRGAGKTSPAANGESDSNDALRSALHATNGSLGRWLDRQEAGLSGPQLRAAIGEEWQGNPGASVHGGYATRGGVKPAIWIGSMVAKGKPTLDGKALLSAVRELLSIPQPGMASTSNDDESGEE
jgi:ParB/RepB/Spo0J family partition protein